jgi:hypothetical protein
MSAVADLKRVYAEGLAASVGAANPYRGRMVLAAVWQHGYRRMLDTCWPTPRRARHICTVSERPADAVSNVYAETAGEITAEKAADLLDIYKSKVLRPKS